ncbi:MAG TPA: acetate/propionate family kinase [Acidobacteriaceae bacterium]|jgi:acetate kinase|nr:acetate/propionate family kinase [Acidobacteriaceae bacterium]
MASESQSGQSAAPTSEPPSRPILVVNSGSSSLKAGIYEAKNGREELALSATASNLAAPDGRLEIRDGAGKIVAREAHTFPSACEALRAIVPAMGRTGCPQPMAVGHRIVHGGPKLREHQRVTAETMRLLEAAIHFAPLHIPAALALLRETSALFPGVPQIACFDTAFHRTLPEPASHFPLPVELWREGILRFGFHGLSYEAIVSNLGPALRPRTVAAHLGNGCSLAALQDGVSVDTSMGLTPTGGIPMSTRSGDLDPGVLLYLLRARGLDADGLEDLLNHRAGLAALSGGRSDLRDLQSAAKAGDAEAALALDVFCRSIAKTIGGYAAVLGGIELLVFTGGIGENSAPVRALAVKDLGFLGIQLDREANQENRAIVSTPGSACQVRIVAADEDRQIAQHSRRLLEQL